MDRMDNNNHAEHGHISIAIAVICGFFNWIADHNVSEIIKNFSGLISIIAAIMAIRYYYYATIKQRK